MSESTPWPTELRLNAEKNALKVSFDDQSSHELAAEYLRVESPSAEVQGHSPEERKTVPSKSGVKITELEPVGNYAVRIIFDDGHDTGLFSWSYLRELGEEKETKWAAYLEDLADKGLQRS